MSTAPYTTPTVLSVQFIMLIWMNPSDATDKWLYRILKFHRFHFTSHSYHISFSHVKYYFRKLRCKHGLKKSAVCRLYALASSIEYEIIKLNIMHIVALRFIFSLLFSYRAFLYVLCITLIAMKIRKMKKRNPKTHLKCVQTWNWIWDDEDGRTTKIHWKPNHKPPKQIEWTCGVYCLLSFIDIIQFVHERKYGELCIIVDILIRIGCCLFVYLLAASVTLVLILLAPLLPSST